MNQKEKSAVQTAMLDRTIYEEERIPFADVMRKLANTKPPHKAAKSVKPTPKKK